MGYQKGIFSELRLECQVPFFYNSFMLLGWFQQALLLGGWYPTSVLQMWL